MFNFTLPKTHNNNQSLQALLPSRSFRYYFLWTGGETNELLLEWWEWIFWVKSPSEARSSRSQSWILPCNWYSFLGQGTTCIASTFGGWHDSIPSLPQGHWYGSSMFECYLRVERWPCWYCWWFKKLTCQPQLVGPISFINSTLPFLEAYSWQVIWWILMCPS